MDKGKRKREYDQEGYDREGFDKNDEDNRQGFGRDGYDTQGYDKDGYDREGYLEDERGDERDRDGYDREGYDPLGYNKDGVKKDGTRRGPDEVRVDFSDRDEGWGIEGRKLYNADLSRNREKERRSNPKLHMLYEQANHQDISDSQVCLGHAFAVLRGHHTVLHNSEIIESSTQGDMQGTTVYEHIRDIFSGKSPVTKPFIFFSGDNVNNHSTLLCMYKPDSSSDQKYLWYYNPLGIHAETFGSGDAGLMSRMSDKIKHLYPDQPFLDKSSLSSDDITAITTYTTDDRKTMVEHFRADSQFAFDYRRIRWVYAYEKILRLAPSYVLEEYAKLSKGREQNTYYNSMNTPYETMVLLKIIFDNNCTEIIPWKKSNAYDGAQSCTNDGLAGFDIITSRTISTQPPVGACAVWSVLYKRMAEVSLDGVKTKEDIREVITDFLPKVVKLGEKHARTLLGKVVVYNNFGFETFNFMDRFYNKLPDRFRLEEEQDDFKRKVVKKYDEARMKIGREGGGDPSKRPAFDPNRQSPRIEIILDFMKHVVTEDISDEEEVQIRKDIVRGGYLTSSLWTQLLAILMLVISCKHKEI